MIKCSIVSANDQVASCCHRFLFTLVFNHCVSNMEDVVDVIVALKCCNVKPSVHAHS